MASSSMSHRLDALEAARNGEESRLVATASFPHRFEVL